jgi:hypothetical protein
MLDQGSTSRRSQEPEDDNAQRFVQARIQNAKAQGQELQSRVETGYVCVRRLIVRESYLDEVWACSCALFIKKELPVCYEYLGVA